MSKRVRGSNSAVRWSSASFVNNPYKRLKSAPSASQKSMGLLTYRRQIQSKRGRSKRTVRRLARAQSSRLYSGSSSSILASTSLLSVTSATTFTNGSSAYLMLGPSLAPFIQQFYENQTINSSASTAHTLRIGKFFNQFQITPDWPAHTNTAVAGTFEFHHFVLKEDTPITDVYDLTNATGSGTGQHSYALNCRAGVTPKAAFLFLRDGFNSRTGPGTSFSAEQTVNQCVSWYDSPDWNARFEFKKSKTVYIPYGQSSTYSWMDPGMTISFRNLDIPETYVAPTGTETDALNTPYLPKGWPFVLIRYWKHSAETDQTSGNFTAKEAFTITRRAYYYIPNHRGRDLVSRTSAVIVEE